MNSAGIGLGLTIVKQIVETGGGQIKVKSDGLGKGSKFSFTMHMDQIISDELVQESVDELSIAKDDSSELLSEKQPYGTTSTER